MLTAWYWVGRWKRVFAMCKLYCIDVFCICVLSCICACCIWDSCVHGITNRWDGIVARQRGTCLELRVWGDWKGVKIYKYVRLEVKGWVHSTSSFPNRTLRFFPAPFTRVVENIVCYFYGLVVAFALASSMRDWKSVPRTDQPLLLNLKNPKKHSDLFEWFFFQKHVFPIWHSAPKTFHMDVK